jgi:hypothetical protein
MHTCQISCNPKKAIHKELLVPVSVKAVAVRIVKAFAVRIVGALKGSNDYFIMKERRI